MSNFGDKYVACPFFFKQEGRKIYCDGFDKGIHLHVSFETNSILNRHKVQYCHSINGCKNCPIYPIINRRYEGDKH